jgi:hypothetical protein
LCDAARCPFRFKARRAARDRRADGRLEPAAAALLADRALRFVVAFALAGGGPSLTPALRAFESPMAIACFVELAPCFPSRM